MSFELSGEDHMGLMALADGLEYLRFATGTRGSRRAGPLSAEVRGRIFDLAETLEGIAQMLSGKTERDPNEMRLRVTQTPEVMGALRRATEAEDRSSK